MTFCSPTIYNDNLYWSDFTGNRDLNTDVDLSPNYERFLWNICDGRGMLIWDAHSSGHLVPSNLGLAYVLRVETNPFPELVMIFFQIRKRKSELLNSTRTFLGFTFYEKVGR